MSFSYPFFFFYIFLPPITFFSPCKPRHYAHPATAVQISIRQLGKHNISIGPVSGRQMTPSSGKEAGIPCLGRNTPISSRITGYLRLHRLCCTYYQSFVIPNVTAKLPTLNLAGSSDAV